MARYIDADKLLDLIIHKDEEPRYGYLDYFDILHAPTADVKEVIRGEWLNCFNKDKGFGKCSICCKEHYDYYSYCPNCGADMRGENNGDN